MEVELLEVEREFLPSRRSLPMRSSMAFGVASGGGGSVGVLGLWGRRGRRRGEDMRKRGKGERGEG